MAINRLRQQQIFDQYDITSGGIMSPYGYGEEDQSQSRAPDIPQRNQPPQMPQTSQPLDMSMFRRGDMATPRVGQSQSDPNSIDTQVQRQLDAINKVYTPQTQATSRFNTLLDQFPVREEPGLGAKIAGATAFLGNKTRGIPGGYEIQDKVMNAPYYRDVAAWTAKTGPFQQGAQQENIANNTERQLATGLVSGVSAAHRTEQAAEAARLRDATARDKQEKDYRIQQERNAILSAANQGAIFDTDGEYVIATYKTGPNAGKAFNTGVKTTNFSPFELENLKQTNRERSIAAAGAEERKTNAAPGGQTGGSLEYERQRQQRMRDVMETVPGANQHIGQSGNGFQMKPRPVVGPTGWFGWGEGISQEKVDEWDRIKQYIDPGYVIPPKPPQQQQQQQQQVTPPPTPGQPENRQGLGPSMPPMGGIPPPPNPRVQPSFRPAPPPVPPQGPRDPGPPLNAPSEQQAPPQPGQMTRQQQLEAVKNGTLYEVVDRRTGQTVGFAPPDTLELYVNHPTLRVKVGGR